MMKTEIFLTGDTNIDWSSMCPLKNKRMDVANACNLTQTNTLPTRSTINRNGLKSSKCIDHLFTNVPDKCTKTVSIALGFTDHNLIAIKNQAP